jgi:hypothetical protein
MGDFDDLPQPTYSEKYFDDIYEYRFVCVLRGCVFFCGTPFSLPAAAFCCVRPFLNVLTFLLPRPPVCALFVATRLVSFRSKSPTFFLHFFFLRLPKHLFLPSTTNLQTRDFAAGHGGAAAAPSSS